MPGDPATNLCPESLCSQDARIEMVKQWHLDSAWSFYSSWISRAVTGDFGHGISYQQGQSVAILFWSSLPNTSLVILIALCPILLGMSLVATGVVNRKWDTLWQVMGAPPAVILSLFAIAALVISYGVQELWLLPIVAAITLVGHL